MFCLLTGVVPIFFLLFLIFPLSSQHRSRNLLIITATLCWSLRFSISPCQELLILLFSCQAPVFTLDSWPVKPLCFLKNSIYYCSLFICAWSLACVCLFTILKQLQVTDSRISKLVRMLESTQKRVLIPNNEFSHELTQFLFFYTLLDYFTLKLIAIKDALITSP